MAETWHCALLRGIGPGNPNMRNDKLRGVLERLGLTGVASVISSGNVIFATTSHQDPAALEDRIQEALRADLGIPGGTILRSREELRALAATEPFDDREHSRSTYLTATFLKHAPDPVPDPLPQPEHPAARLIGYDAEARAVLAVTNTTASSGPDLMTHLERELGKEITTRTWLTVTRILKRFPA